MLEVVFRIVAGILFAILGWLVFIPIGFVLATPVAFLFALCRRDGTFKGKLRNEYRQFWEFWKTLGVLMVPPW
jgi:hypothetical protein